MFGGFDHLSAAAEAKAVIMGYFVFVYAVGRKALQPPRQMRNAEMSRSE
jgi:hypothetical protein